jgi:hypothetical protein
MSVQPSPGAGGAVEREQESTLGDVVTTILDKGVVVDVFARVSLVGIELLRVDARVVIASVDTYLRFAEATNRLGMGEDEPSQLPEVVDEISQSGSAGKTKGALEAGVDKLGDLIGDDESKEKEPARRGGKGSDDER